VPGLGYWFNRAVGNGAKQAQEAEPRVVQKTQDGRKGKGMGGWDGDGEVQGNEDQEGCIRYQEKDMLREIRKKRKKNQPRQTIIARAVWHMKLLIL
jgi:hypothetical protein